MKISYFFLYLNSLILCSFADFSEEQTIDNNHYLICQNQKYNIKNDLLNKVKNKYKYLEEDIFFKRDFIVNTKEVKKTCKNIKEHIEINIKTKDNKIITCSLFKRNSNTLFVVGPGFTNQKEKMIPFAAMFHEYDVLLINFRGHSENILGIDLETKLGTLEDQDIQEIVRYIKNIFNYKKIIGLGICYGGYNIAKAQAMAEKNGEKIFDALVIDGCWLSLEGIVERLCKDPYLIKSPQKGGAPYLAKILIGSDPIIFLTRKLIEYLTNIESKDLKATNWIKYLHKTPILFIQAQNDLVVSWQDFITIYNSCPAEDKIAWITPHAHVINHLKSKETYKYLVEKLLKHETTKKISKKIINDQENRF